MAGRAAIVYCDWDGAYNVVDDPQRQLTDDEADEKEAYQVLITAAHYLEVDLARLGSVEVQDLTRLIVEGAPFSRSWLVKLNAESCIIDRYDEQDGPRYAIHVSPT